MTRREQIYRHDPALLTGSARCIPPAKVASTLKDHPKWGNIADYAPFVISFIREIHPVDAELTREKRARG